MSLLSFSSPGRPSYSPMNSMHARVRRHLFGLVTQHANPHSDGKSYPIRSISRSFVNHSPNEASYDTRSL